jgi:predicted phosphodiesterase
MKRFAVLSDIHANLGALNACVERVEALSRADGMAERMPIVVLGDVLDSGPYPKETLDRVLEIGDVFLRGNHEDYVFDYARNPQNSRYQDPLWKLIPWSYQCIGSEAVEAFRKVVVFGHAQCEGRVRFFHASPDSNGRNPEFFDAQEANAALLPPVFEGSVGSLCFAGHNHYAGLYTNPLRAQGDCERELWVNCGSVGYPFVAKESEDPVATFVTASVDERASHLMVRVEFHRVVHSGAALLRAFVESGCLAATQPFARAILCQCYFNEDVVYPFFQAAKKQGWRQPELSKRLELFLEQNDYSRRLEAAFEQHGVYRL